MLTFQQFLTEKLYDAADTRHGYCEIFVNPTDGEMREVGNVYDDEYSNPFLDTRGVCYYLGALVDDKRVFVFDRESTQHEDALKAYKQKNPKWDPNILTLYFYYYPKTKHMGLGTSDFSSPGPLPPKSKIMMRLKAMAWFKKFKLFEW